MSVQEDVRSYADQHDGTAQAGDAVARPLYHPCPFCGGVIVGRNAGPQLAVRFECTQCVTVIYFPAEPEAPTFQ